MYLYKDWIKYTVSEDRTMINKKQATFDILDAMNRVKFNSNLFEELIIPKLDREHILCPPWLRVDTWPYLQWAIPRYSLVGNWYIKPKNNSSISIFKDAYLTWKDEDWIYTIDISYDVFMCRQFIDSLPVVTGKEDLIPLLVPRIFKGFQFPIVITQQMIIQDTIISIPAENI